MIEYCPESWDVYPVTESIVKLSELRLRNFGASLLHLREELGQDGQILLVSSLEQLLKQGRVEGS